MLCDRLELSLGSVLAQGAVETLVGVTPRRSVLVVLARRDEFPVRQEHDYSPDDARALADLLEDAADIIDRVEDDETHRVGRVATPRDGATVVRAQWPLVGMAMYHWREDPLDEVQYTPRRACRLAELLESAADVIEPP